MNPYFKSLFQPLEMPNLKLKNRFVMAPMGTGFDEGEQATVFFVERAKGGVAVIHSAQTSAILGGGTGAANEPSLESDDDIAVHAKVVAAVHKAGAKIVNQLTHCGRLSPACVAPVDIEPNPNHKWFQSKVRGLSLPEVEEYIELFAKAAARAQKAGYDGVEILSSSGYLLSTFLSPVTNKRTDKYGGDAKGRATFVTSIIRETRNATGPDFNICVKYDADDGVEGGVTLKESPIFATLFQEAGADRLNIWAGWHDGKRSNIPMYTKRGALAEFSAEIKKVVSIPVCVAGRINNPFTAAEILDKGQADLIVIGRALLADPEFVNKAEQGRESEIRMCVACAHCFDVQVTGQPDLECTVNPELGREFQNLIQEAPKKKNIAVVGSGPAGLEAARVAAVRGHKVTLYEKGPNIGGLLNLAAVPPYKEELKSIPNYYKRQIELLNINLKLNTEFKPDLIKSEKFDTVILATGSRPCIPAIEGIDESGAVSALKVLEGEKLPGNSVIIIGGGLVGLETGEYLAAQGKNVTVVEMLERAGMDMGPTSRWPFMARIKTMLKIMTSTRVAKMSPNKVTVVGKDNVEQELAADAIVYAIGMECVCELNNEIATDGVEYHIVGSCKSPGMIYDAIRDGFELGRIL